MENNGHEYTSLSFPFENSLPDLRYRKIFNMRSITDCSERDNRRGQKICESCTGIKKTDKGRRYFSRYLLPLFCVSRHYRVDFLILWVKQFVVDNLPYAGLIPLIHPIHFIGCSTLRFSVTPCHQPFSQSTGETFPLPAYQYRRGIVQGTIHPCVIACRSKMFAPTSSGLCASEAKRIATCFSLKIRSIVSFMPNSLKP